MRVLLFFIFFLLALNLFGQDICVGGLPSDEPFGCAPCGGVYLNSPAGDTIEINVIAFISDSLKKDTTLYNFPCGTIEKGAWFSYFANKEGAISFSFFQNICFDSFDVEFDSEVEIGLYDVDLNFITCGLTDSSFTYSNLAPNQEVQVLLDATSKKSCLIGLQFNSPRIFNNIEPISKINASVETDAYCLTEEVCFNVDPVDGASTYGWTPPKNATIISGGQSSDNEICVRFESVGTDTIRVTPSNPCNQGQSVIRTFGVYDFNIPPGQITAPTGSIICQGSSVCFDYKPENPQSEFVWNVPDNFEIQQGGDTSEMTICGEVIDFENGFLELSVRPLEGCNQAILRIPIQPDSPTTLLPEIITCEENFPIEVEGQFFEESGYYSVVKSNINGCDSVISFRISLDVPTTGIYQEIICPEALCVPIGDSCYDISSRIVMVDRPYPLCDSMVILSPLIEVFDEVFCSQTGNNIFFDWTLLELADAYAINLNGMLDTVTTNTYFLDQLSSDSLLQFSVQPIGDCAFPEMLSVSCNFDFVGNQNQYIDSKIKVHPNPSDNLVYLETDLKIESVEIYDLSGRLIDSKKATSFSLKKYGEGLYIFKIKTVDGVGMKRILIH